ncbi:MAG: hypothetical protein AB1483_01845 [Candidatus Zixiibacteriota bacterium]
MGIAELFAAAAQNLISRYQNLTENITKNHTPSYNCEKSQPEQTAASDDTYSPMVDVPLEAASLEPEPELTASADEPQTRIDDPAEETPDETLPVEPEDDNAEATDANYRYRRLTKFAYEVQLEFQLSAFSRIAQEISDGNVESFEEFAAAGFGLKAAMDFKGHQLTQTDQPSELTDGQQVRAKNSVRAQNAASFAAQSRNFELDTFSDEASKIKHSMNSNSSRNFSNTVKKFSLRYRMDTQFSFAFLNKFNVQTSKMAETDPQNLDPYVTSAGNVAEKGTPEMMATFFDAVDAYLNQAEEQLLAKANEFFDFAVSELELSGELVDLAREHLTGSIASFFSRVDEAVGAIKSKFVPTSAAEPVTKIEVGPAQELELLDSIVDENPPQLATA